jgi:hypothetical protein
LENSIGERLSPRSNGSGSKYVAMSCDEFRGLFICHTGSRKPWRKNQTCIFSLRAAFYSGTLLDLSCLAGLRREAQAGRGASLSATQGPQYSCVTPHTASDWHVLLERRGLDHSVEAETQIASPDGHVRLCILYKYMEGVPVIRSYWQC